MLHKLPQCTRQIQEPDINMTKSIKKKVITDMLYYRKSHFNECLYNTRKQKYFVFGKLITQKLQRIS